MNVCVIGTGYVGLVTGACFAEFGVQVTCVDKDAAKIDALERARSRSTSRASRTWSTQRAGGAAAVHQRHCARPSARRWWSSSPWARRRDRTAAPICRFVEAVAREIGAEPGRLQGRRHEEHRAGRHRAKVRGWIEERARYGAAASRAFSVASNPEFLREGAAIEDFMRPGPRRDRHRGRQAPAILKDLYRPLYLIETPIVLTNVAPAELIKYARNAFLATKISFINEMADLCEKRRRRRPGDGAGHGPRPPDRHEVPARRARLRRLVLSEGHALGGAFRRARSATLKIVERSDRGERAPAPGA